MDAHITLFYLRSHFELAGEVASRMEAHLAQMGDRRGGLPPDLVTAGMLNANSREGYAWIDLLVACRAHETMHRVLAVGLEALPSRGRMRGLRPSFHLSIRRGAS